MITMKKKNDLLMSGLEPFFLGLVSKTKEFVITMEGLSYHVQNPTHVKPRRLRVLLTNYVALPSFESAEK